MKKIILLLTLLISVNAIGQITSASYTNKGATVPFINSSSYKLNGTTLDSANTVKRGFFTSFQYKKIQNIYSTGTNIGVNNSNPLFPLSVTGKTYLKGNVTIRLGTEVTDTMLNIEDAVIINDVFNLNINTKKISFDPSNSGYMLGVGTSNPTATLTVNGNLLISGNKATFNLSEETKHAFRIYDVPNGNPIFDVSGNDDKLIEIDSANVGYKVGIGVIPTHKLDVNGTSRFGTSSNYSSTEDDGTFVMVGDATVYKDAIVSFIYSGGTGEAKLDTYIGGIKQLKFLTNDLVYLSNTEAPHDWDEATEIEIHLHWMVKNALIAGDKVRWQLEYAVANIVANGNTNTLFCDPANPTVFGSRTVIVEYTAPVGGIPAGTHLYTTFETVTPTNFKIGAGFIGTLTRIAKTAGGTDPTTGSIFASNVGIHYKVNTIGSRTTSAK